MIESVKYKNFEFELKALINKHSLEEGSNIPDYLISAYIMACLSNLNIIITARDRFQELSVATKDITTYAYHRNDP